MTKVQGPSTNQTQGLRQTGPANQTKKSLAVDLDKAFSKVRDMNPQAAAMVASGKRLGLPADGLVDDSEAAQGLAQRMSAGVDKNDDGTLSANLFTLGGMTSALEARFGSLEDLQGAEDITATGNMGLIGDRPEFQELEQRRRELEAAGRHVSLRQQASTDGTEDQQAALAAELQAKLNEYFQQHPEVLEQTAATLRLDTANVPTDENRALYMASASVEVHGGGPEAMLRALYALRKIVELKAPDANNFSAEQGRAQLSAALRGGSGLPPTGPGTGGGGTKGGTNVGPF